MYKTKLVSVFTVILIAGSLAATWVNRYNIYDFINLRGYSPPSKVAKLASDDTMSDMAKRLFYVNKPQISDRSVFNEQCKNAEQTIVLGCYTGTNIYIFNVDDPRMQGVEQVTAAHEMLHVAYSRLSRTERNKIDNLVNAAYAKIKDPRIAALKESYRKQDASNVPNELHSILGTEVRDLGPELEEYYARYFISRSNVVYFSETYEHVFEELKLQVRHYDADLALRKNEIDQKQTYLENQGRRLEAQKRQIDNYLVTGEVQEYNSSVSQYNSDVNSYNQEIALLKNMIEDYNRIVTKRNSLVVEQQNLAKSIDSRPQTIAN